MANWCFNVLKMNNIDRILGTLNNNKYFDFRRFIPEPACEADCPEEYILDKNDTTIIPRDDKPWLNWYKWRVENWNTNHNACDFEYVNENTIRFDTAWSVPFPVLKIISKQFPEEDIVLSTRWKMNFMSELVTYRNGEIVNARKFNYDFETDGWVEIMEDGSEVPVDEDDLI